MNIFIFQANLTQLGRNEYVPGVGMGIAKCPFDPSDNSTAVWVENGNPGRLPALYSGTNAEFTKADAVIFRTDLYNYTTGRREYTFKRTLKYDSKWLDSKLLSFNFIHDTYVSCLYDLFSLMSHGLFIHPLRRRIETLYVYRVHESSRIRLLVDVQILFASTIEACLSTMLLCRQTYC